MRYFKWLIFISTLTTLLCSPYIYITLYNYYIDPLWNYEHSNKHNQYQIAFDERQLKTNRLSASDEEFDTLIMGTSRSTYINQHNFGELNVFNYSTSSMHINEYNAYIEYAKKRSKDEFDYIFLEVFPKHLAYPNTYENPQVYIDTANAPFYKIKSLFSMDTYNRAKNNFDLILDKGLIRSRIYNRENVATVEPLDLEFSKENSAAQLNQINEELLYEYDLVYKELLKEIKENNPNTTFILYSPPYLAERFLKEFEGENGYKIYSDWLKDCLEIFGEVNNFLYVNSITINQSNYYDSHHFYPEIGDLIITKLIGDTNSDLPSDFGVKVNNQNMEEHLDFIRIQLAN